LQNRKNTSRAPPSIPKSQTGGASS
jgi:hypothetical protein